MQEHLQLRNKKCTSRSTTRSGKGIHSSKDGQHQFLKTTTKLTVKFVKKELVAGLSELKKHLQSKKHQELSKAVTGTRPITTMIVADTISEKEAEVKMAAFLVEHHLPFQAMDHLSDLVTDIFPGSEIAAQFHSKHTKTRAIVKHVIADHFRGGLYEQLKNTLFSIIIDETTDISSEKLLAIVVQFFCTREKRVN